MSSKLNMDESMAEPSLFSTERITGQVIPEVLTAVESNVITRHSPIV